jgi:MFS superfamily sulfate permease-like transporter
LNIQALKREWFSNVRADILAGSVVALALIPEAIAFSIIAGVDPKIGLYASFIIAMTTAIFRWTTRLNFSSNRCNGTVNDPLGEGSRLAVFVSQPPF